MKKELKKRKNGVNEVKRVNCVKEENERTRREEEGKKRKRVKK